MNRDDVRARNAIDQLAQLQRAQGADWSDDAEWGDQDEGEREPPVTLAQWLERELPEPDRLLGHLLTTTCRALLVGPTGLGKTMFGIAIAVALPDGNGFLHWDAGRKCRVLYIDGEMSARLMKQRLREAADRIGSVPDGLIIISKEDYPEMPPLNLPVGQKWLDNFVKKHAPIDLIIFDNVQALLAGDQSKEESWSPMLPWVRSLTRRSIGQIWFHHTGHDEARSYGTKTREWQMDTVILMERVETSDADLAFTLKFTKARERTPENRDDFEAVTMSLVDDQWTVGKSTDKTNNRPSSHTQRLAVDALISLAAEYGEPLPTTMGLPAGIRAIPIALFKNEVLARGIVDGESKNPRARFRELLSGLRFAISPLKGTDTSGRF
jgi:RecA-family ATPase